MNLSMLRQEAGELFRLGAPMVATQFFIIGRV